METIHLIPDHILQAFGWTVVHSLWQGFLIALVLGIYLYQKPTENARRRYFAGFVSLASILAASFITFFVVLDHPESGLAFFAEGEAIELFELGQSLPLTFAERLNENMPLIVLAWLIGMAFFLLKMMGGLLYVQRLKHRQLAAVPAKWIAVLDDLKSEIGLSTPVRLSASALVKVPIVVGWLKPVILMPLGAVNQLTVEQVEAILAHELAHIARYDYVMNLVQAFMEVVFYFNPAVWWISANIRIERENCCDDLAVQLCGNPFNYARALVSLQEMHQASPAFALSFAKGKNQLLNRIRRILKQPHKNSNAMEKFSIIGLVLAAVIMLSMQKSNHNIYQDEELSGEYLSVQDWEFNEFDAGQDTIPKKGTIHWHKEVDGEEVEIKIKDGEIKYLKIDGEEIPEEEYKDHEGEVMEMLENIPPPPPPPPAPRFREPARPDAPAAPRRFEKAEVAPVPPRFEAPPAPPAPPSPIAPKITTERDGKNTMIIIDNGMGTEPIEIEVEGGRKGEVIINGKEVEGLKDGEEVVVVENLFPGNRLHLFPQGNANGFIFPESNDENIWMLDEFKVLEDAYVLKELEARELEGFIAEALEKSERAMERAEILRLNGSEFESLLGFSELEHVMPLRLEGRAFEELSDEEREAWEKQQEEVKEELERAMEKYQEAMKKLNENQRENMRRFRREMRRADGAM